MQTLLGFDLPTAQKVIIASVVILVLLILLGLFVRQIKGGRLRMRGQGGGRARQPRLGVVDTHDLDRQRQLVLIRRDNVEHLLMIGGASDVVVETNILRSGARANMPLPPDGQPTERPMAFDPILAGDLGRGEPVEEPRRTPAQPAAPIALAVPEPETLLQRAAPPKRSPEPKPAQPQPAQPQPVQSQPPQAQPAEVTAASVAPAIAVALGAAAQAASQPSAPAVQAPSFAREHSPAPAASVGELDDMTRQLEEALKRPFSAVRPATAPVVPQEMVRPLPGPTQPEEEAAPIAMPPPPPSISTARPIATPGDVEAELELALGLKPERVGPRPSAGLDKPFAMPEPVEPAPAVAASSIPEPGPEPIILAGEPEPKPFADEKRAPMGSEPVETDWRFDPEPEPGETPDRARHQEPEQVEFKAQDEVVPDERKSDEGKSHEGKSDASKSGEPGSDKPTPGEPEQAKPEPQPAAIDPFSVDAIEAEFARLLGREPKSRS